MCCIEILHTGSGGQDLNKGSIPQMQPYIHTYILCDVSCKCLLQSIFEQVEFKQANLANTASVEKAFHSDDGNFHYVFNLAAETKYSQSDEVYTTS